MTAQAVKRGCSLQEMLAASSKRQIAAAAFATGVPAHRLTRYAIGATALNPEEAQSVASFLLRGSFMIKRERGDDKRTPVHIRAAKARASRHVSQAR
jgi:hypothetical protein